jgi:hypothetical protein
MMNLVQKERIALGLWDLGSEITDSSAARRSHEWRELFTG